MQQADHLFHPWEDRHLFGDGLAHALFAQQVAHIPLDLTPVGANLFEHVDLLGVEVGGNLHRPCAQADVQAVGQAVGNVCADHQRAIAQFSAAECRGRCCRGLADPSFAKIEQDAHQL